MFQKFFKMLTPLLMAHKYHLDPPTKSYQLTHRAETAVISALQSSADVFIHWGVYQSGKSTAARQAAQRLQDEHGRLVIYRKGYNTMRLSDFSHGFCKNMYLPETKPMSASFDKPTSIVIDDFDLFIWTHVKDNSQGFLEMIADARSSQKFNILLVITSWETAREVMDLTGACLVGNPDVGRWTAEELTKLYNTIPITGRRCKEDYDTQLKASLLGGCPGLITSLLRDEENLNMTTLRSKIYDREWRNGGLALTGGVPQGPGRFPDSKGIFHFD
jgi:hypothetical protein